MNDSNNPHFSELLDWLEGKLPPAGAQAVAQRLEAADTATQADLDWLRLFLQASQAVQFSSLPASVRETLKERFAAYAEARQPPAFFQRLLAALTFDSRAQPATAGLRSVQRADETQSRQLIYTADAAEIALSIRPTLPDQSFIVTGQIFPTGDIPAHAFSIQLLRDVREVGLAAADELGEFAFPNMPAGEYDMVVSTEEYEVMIHSLRLQQ
jgi:hypothetical protein